MCWGGGSLQSPARAPPPSREWTVLPKGSGRTVLRHPHSTAGHCGDPHTHRARSLTRVSDSHTLTRGETRRPVGLVTRVSSPQALPRMAECAPPAPSHGWRKSLLQHPPLMVTRDCCSPKALSLINISTAHQTLAHACTRGGSTWGGGCALCSQALCVPKSKTCGRGTKTKTPVGERVGRWCRG